MAGGFQIAWKIEGVKELSRVLQGMQTGLKDFSKPFGQSADMLVNLFSRDVFASQGAVIGETWARLSPRTVAQKARQGMPNTPLIASGHMRGDFTSVVRSDQATVSNSAEYFKYHQSNKPRSKIPRRVMMKLNENSKQQIVKYFQIYIKSNMKT